MWPGPNLNPLFLGALFLPQGELQEAEDQRTAREAHRRDGGKRPEVAESQKLVPRGSHFPGL